MSHACSNFTGLLDERSEPDFRTLFGSLAAESTAIDVAVGRIRLAGVDLDRRELGGVGVLRVVVAELGAGFAQEAESVLNDPARRPNLELLIQLVHRGTIDLRSAPLAGWSPDFSVFHGPDGPKRLIVGTHWFQRPFPHRGPAHASVHGPGEASRAALRFEELWATAHDLRPAVQEALGVALERAPERPREPSKSPELLDSKGRFG